MNGERKPRWWLRILIIILVLGVLAGAAELALRLIFPGVIASAARDRLGLSASHPVEVSLGGSVLVHSLQGQLGHVDVTIDDVELVEGLRGDVALTADAIPFDFSNGAISGGTAELTVNRDELDSAISLLTSGLADGAEVRGGELVVSRTLEMFGASVPLSISLDIAVEEGDVRVEPRSIKAVGFDLTTEQIRSAAGGALDELLSPHVVCVRDRLPVGVTFADLNLSSSGSVELDVTFDHDILSNPAKRATGSCD